MMNVTPVARLAMVSMRLIVSLAPKAGIFGSRKLQAWTGSAYHATPLPCSMAPLVTVWSAVAMASTMASTSVTMAIWRWGTDALQIA